MRRLFLILFAILIPLQSAAAAIVSIAGMPGMATANCEQTFSAQSAIAAHEVVATSDCGCGDHTGAPSANHGSMHHSCPHLGIATIAMPCAALPAIFALNSPVRTEHASFDSIVLGVPSPPPTFLA
ncbi:MAG: hypothetical protein ACM3PU_10470 [Gemmatimonadota bacterium]